MDEQTPEGRRLTRVEPAPTSLPPGTERSRLVPARNESQRVALSKRHRPVPDAISSLTKKQRGLVEVVGLASQFNVPDRREPSFGERLDVMEFQEGRLAAPPAGADERTASLIALPDFALDRRGDVTAGARSCRRRARCRCRGASASLQVREQEGHRPVQKGREITRRTR